MNTFQRIIATLVAFGTASLVAARTSDGCPKGWQRPFDVDENLYPFDSHCLQMEEGLVHYLDEAAALGVDARGTVVLVHGNPAWSFLYRKQVQAFKREGFRVIAVDLLGFGMSEKPSPKVFSYSAEDQARVLGEVLARIELRSFYMVVQDWGGPIGLQAAVRHHERIAGLLIMNTFAWPMEPAGLTKSTVYHNAFDWALENLVDEDAKVAAAKLPHVAEYVARVQVGATESELAAIKHAYLAPFQESNGRLRHEHSYFPVRMLAAELITGRQFLQKLEQDLRKLQSIPVVFMMSDDNSFGPIKTDATPLRPRCPGNLSPRDPAEVRRNKDFCVDRNGNQVWYTVDRWLANWDADKVVGVWKSLAHGHFLQEEVPDEVVHRFLDLVRFSEASALPTQKQSAL